MFLRKLGKRGAEMVEYAIVLACIAAVGVTFYSSNDSNLTKVLDGLFGKVTAVVDLALGANQNKHPEFSFDTPSSRYKDAIVNVVDTMYKTFNKDGRPLASVEWDDKGKIKYVEYFTQTGKKDDRTQEGIMGTYGVSNISSLFDNSAITKPTYGGYLAFDREGNLIKQSNLKGNGSQFTHMSFDYDGTKSILIEGNVNSTGGVDFTKLSSSALDGNGMMQNKMKYYID